MTRQWYKALRGRAFLQSKGLSQMEYLDPITPYKLAKTLNSSFNQPLRTVTVTSPDRRPIHYPLKAEEP